jgi:glycosyltransferase involved in cell wall biosynthesis
MKNDLSETEVIVVDDCSREDLDDIRDNYPVKLISLDENSGPAYARNRGAGIAAGDVLFFMDSDIVPPNNLISTVKAEFSGDEHIDVLSLLSDPTDPEGNFVMNYLSLQENYWVEQFFDKGSDTAYVKIFTTRNGAVTKAVFNDVNGFDPKFRTNALEDYDFSSRLADDCRVKWIKQPTVLHKFPDRMRKISRNYFIRCAQFVDYKFNNGLMMDKVQTSSHEMLVRMLAGITLPLMLAAFFYPYALASLAVLLGIYIAMTSGLLKHMSGYMGINFAIKALLFHYVLSLAICAGGVYGLVAHIRRRLVC